MQKRQSVIAKWHAWKSNCNNFEWQYAAQIKCWARRSQVVRSSLAKEWLLFFWPRSHTTIILRASFTLMMMTVWLLNAKSMIINLSPMNNFQIIVYGEINAGIASGGHSDITPEELTKVTYGIKWVFSWRLSRLIFPGSEKTEKTLSSFVWQFLLEYHCKIIAMTGST